MIVVAFFSGIVFGALAGLIPGLHINLIASIVVALSGFLLEHFTLLDVAVFVVAMGVTQSFLEAVPSIFLGAPDSEMGLILLPGHRLLLEGRGYDAVRFTVLGALSCLALTVLLFPLILLAFPALFALLRPVLGWVLLGLIVVLIAKEGRDWWKALLVFGSTGMLGIIVLRWLSIQQPLLPLLSGIFGASSLVLALSSRARIPVQHDTSTGRLTAGETAKGILGGILGGTLVTLFPGLGPGNAGALATLGIRATSNAYLVLLGGLHAADFTASLATLVALGKARNGAIAAVQEMMTISANDLWLLGGIALSAGAIAAVLALGCARMSARLLDRVNYPLLSAGVLAFLTLLVLIISGWKGMLVLAASTLLGLLAPKLNVSRAHAMGCLLVPVLTYYL